MTRQGTVEASTRGGLDTSLLVQNMDGRLDSVDSLRTSTQFRLALIPSADEALRDLGTFAFVELHIFSMGGNMQHQ